ncbi:MAG: hypothetical protein PVJ33_06770 [Lysobacterales bacterium]|jgi:hypothetical protein
MLPELTEPKAIQDFLDTLDYNCTERTLCPRDVLKERMAHCMDGAVFAASALESIGYPPLLVDLRAVDDDDHVIAVFREDGLWGAVAKSNTTSLRFRPPVFRTIRELAMSYFAVYFNTKGEMSLYEYSRPFSLRRYRGSHLTAPDIAFIGDDLDRTAHSAIVSRERLKSLPIAPPYLIDACFAGADPDGLFKA